MNKTNNHLSNDFLSKQKDLNKFKIYSETKRSPNCKSIHHKILNDKERELYLENSLGLLYNQQRFSYPKVSKLKEIATCI